MNLRVKIFYICFIMGNIFGDEALIEDYKDILKSRIPLDRFGDPKDVANTVLFLCSNLSDYITGETIHVNGGMYFSWQNF